MTRFILLFAAMASAVIAQGAAYTFRFNSTPLPQAIRQIMGQHPELDVNFIYDELENYKTSATVNADNADMALRQMVGLNPVSVTRSRGVYYLEAMQKGRFTYSGRVMGSDKEPVVAATIFLLAPKDSTVLTYAVADTEGRFSIPCDSRKVIAKFSSMGYRTKYVTTDSFGMGTIVMQEITHKLKEVGVEADIQTEYSDRSVFLPTNRQKQSSAGALELLDQMAIPMININPQTGSVTTNSNQDVSIYIDYSAATQNDMDALNPDDVKSVEYLINPLDPRFQHSRYVVNILLRKYEYGGYGKLRGTANIVAGSYNGLAYGKMTYKKMTYDLSVSDTYRDTRHGGADESRTYTLGDGEKVTRDTRVTDYHNQSNRISAAFRAKYVDEKKIISNRVTFSYTNTPHRDSGGELSFTPQVFNGDTYSQKFNSRVVYPRYNGEFYFDFGNNLALSLSPSFDYYHVNSDNHYRSEASDIITIARENMFEGALRGQLNKQFNGQHSLGLMFNFAENYDRVVYSGSSPSVQRFRQGLGALLLTYGFNTKKLFAQITLGVGANWDNIDGVNTKDILPAAYASVQYAFNKKNSLEVGLQYDINTMDLSAKGTNIVQNNELLYMTGNPELRTPRVIRGELSYNWAPMKQLSVSADAGYFEIFKRPVPVFVPYKDGTAVLRTMEDNGNYAYEYVGLSMTARLFNKSLVLSLKPQLWFYQTTGEYDERKTSFLYNFSARYYFGKFHISAYCNSGEDMLIQQSMWSTRERDHFTWGLTAGWGNGKWTVQATAYNLFRTSWVDYRTWLNSKYFSSKTVDYSSTAHQWFKVTATYTFRYGKKVRKGDEISEGSDASSAIMK